MFFELQNLKHMCQFCLLNFKRITGDEDLPSFPSSPSLLLFITISRAQKAISSPDFGKIKNIFLHLLNRKKDLFTPDAIGLHWAALPRSVPVQSKAKALYLIMSVHNTVLRWCVLQNSTTCSTYFQHNMVQHNPLQHKSLWPIEH